MVKKKSFDKLAKTENLTDAGLAVLSSVLGMVLGAGLGRWSFLVGAGGTLIAVAWGEKKQQAWAIPGFAGMIASNGFPSKKNEAEATDEAVSGIGLLPIPEGHAVEVANGKTRMINSIRAFGKKLYLDNGHPVNKELYLSGLRGLGNTPTTLYVEGRPIQMNRLSSDQAKRLVGYLKNKNKQRSLTDTPSLPMVSAPEEISGYDDMSLLNGGDEISILGNMPEMKDDFSFVG